MSYVCIPSITVICYVMAELFKLIFKKKSKYYKGILIFVGIVGGAWVGAHYALQSAGEMRLKLISIIWLIIH